MNDQEFRAVLDWFMCSDPWPDGPNNHQIITNWLNRESQSRGFDGWVVAFHELGKEVVTKP